MAMTFLTWRADILLLISCTRERMEQHRWFFLDRILCERSSLSSYSIALGVVLNLQDRNVASKNPAVRTQTIGKQEGLFGMKARRWWKTVKWFTECHISIGFQPSQMIIITQASRQRASEFSVGYRAMTRGSKWPWWLCHTRNIEISATRRWRSGPLFLEQALAGLLWVKTWKTSTPLIYQRHLISTSLENQVSTMPWPWTLILISQQASARALEPWQRFNCMTHCGSFALPSKNDTSQLQSNKDKHKISISTAFAPPKKGSQPNKKNPSDVRHRAIFRGVNFFNIFFPPLESSKFSKVRILLRCSIRQAIFFNKKKAEFGLLKSKHQGLGGNMTDSEKSWFHSIVKIR